MSAKILKLAAPRGMSMCEAREHLGEDVLALRIVGHRVQQFGALDHAHLSPLALERGAARGHGRVDLGLAGLVHLANNFIGGRVAVFEGLGGGDEFAVDEVQELFHGA